MEYPQSQKKKILSGIPSGRGGGTAFGSKGFSKLKARALKIGSQVLTGARRAHAPTYTWSNKSGNIQKKVGFKTSSEAKSSKVVENPEINIKVGSPTAGTRAAKQGKGKYGIWGDVGYDLVGKRGVWTQSRLVTAEKAAGAAAATIGAITIAAPDNVTRSDNASVVTTPKKQKRKPYGTLSRPDAAAAMSKFKSNKQVRQIKRIFLVKTSEAKPMLQEGKERSKLWKHARTYNKPPRKPK